MMTTNPEPQPEMTFENELRALLNRYSAEAPSGTPDFILAEFMLETLKAFNEAVSKRAVWRAEDIQLPPAHEHIVVQHRDYKEPWCDKCKLNRNFDPPRSFSDLLSRPKD